MSSSSGSLEKGMIALAMIVALAIWPSGASAETNHPAPAKTYDGLYQVSPKLMNGAKHRCHANYSGKPERVCLHMQKARKNITELVMNRYRARALWSKYRQYTRLANWCESHARRCSTRYHNATHGCAARSTNQARIDCWNGAATSVRYKYELMSSYHDPAVPSGPVGRLLKGLNAFTPPDNTSRHVSLHWTWLGGVYGTVLFSRTTTTRLYNEIPHDTKKELVTLLCGVSALATKAIAGACALTAYHYIDLVNSLKSAHDQNECLQFKVFVPLGPIAPVRNQDNFSVQPCY